MSYQDRAALADALDTLEIRIRKIRGKVSVCCADHDDEDWPAEYPPVVAVEWGLRAVTEGVDDLELAVAATKRNYRREVLQWLLAETEAS